MSQTLAQRRTALVRANQAKSAMAAVKREVAAGELELAEAVEDPRAANLRVYDLLRARRSIGKRKASIICVRLCISEVRRVRELSPRQRALIAAAGSGAVTRDRQLALSMAAAGGELVIA